MKTRDTRGRKRDEKIAPPCRQTESQRAADQGQDEALDQELANDLPARRAHRGADREFPRPRRAARRQEVRQICAGDEQDEPDRA